MNPQRERKSEAGTSRIVIGEKPLSWFALIGIFNLKRSPPVYLFLFFISRSSHIGLRAHTVRDSHCITRWLTRCVCHTHIRLSERIQSNYAHSLSVRTANSVAHDSARRCSRDSYSCGDSYSLTVSNGYPLDTIHHHHHSTHTHTNHTRAQSSCGLPNVNSSVD